MTSRHAEVMEAAGFWRQFVVAFYFEKPTDWITGTLVAYRSEGRGHDAVPCIKLQAKSGRVYEITAYQERLKAELVRAAPVKGDEVTIRYLGEAEKAAPGMNKAKLFEVTVTPPGSQPEAGAESEASGEVGSENEPRAGSKRT